MNLAQPLVRDIPQLADLTRTKDYEECRAKVRAATSSTHRLSVGKRSDFLGFTHRGYSVGKLHLDLVQVDTSNGFEVYKEKPNDQYYFQFLLQGSCKIQGLSSPGAQAQPGNIFVIEPNQVTHEFWSGQCLQLLARVPRESIEHAMSAELGRRITGRITFQPVARDVGISSWLRHLIGAQLRSNEQHSILNDARVLRDFERAILTMLLAGVPHNKSDELADSPSRIAPYYVKRAEDHIRSAATGEITMEDIVQAAGVSERTLFYGFKRWRSTTPMAYVWDVRLALARKELKNARRTGGTVSQAAINAGFTTFSHFAKIYKARYGETPSATLRGLGASATSPD